MCHAPVWLLFGRMVQFTARVELTAARAPIHVVTPAWPGVHRTINAKEAAARRHRILLDQVYLVVHAVFPPFWSAALSESKGDEAPLTPVACRSLGISGESM